MGQNENLEIISALDELEKSKGISKQVLLEALEAALVSAFKRHYGSSQNVRISIDTVKGNILVLSRRNVVEEVQDSKPGIQTH